jgi:IS605 OrfB family transposase
MARKQPGSSNRAKAKVKVARAHRKVRQVRADFLHRTSTNLVRRHDVIVIEDLNVAGMIRNRRLAKAISDTGWGGDLNAAKNILAAGLAVTACGADVRHSGSPRVQSAGKQEPQPARAVPPP